VQVPLEHVAHDAVSIPDAISTARARSRSTLDTLSLLESEALEALFSAGEPPALRELQGHPRGRVLAMPGFDSGWVAGVLRSVHASSAFPWEGKSFDAEAGAARGIGINRVRLGVRGGLFPFRTYQAVSIVDGSRCIAIDYDVPANPRVARSTYDEVRRVGDGLYLGRGMRRRAGGGAKLLLWFGLDARVQDPPVRMRSEP
jgi:hypothetical protein